MPKLKTRKAAAKRFKATGTGKFMRRRAFRSHLLDHKSPKRKRYLGTMALVDERDADNVSAMLPYALRGLGPNSLTFSFLIHP